MLKQSSIDKTLLNRYPLYKSYSKAGKSVKNRYNKVSPIGLTIKEIYDIIMVEKGDTITIKDMEENKKLGKENDILKYFYNMLKEIVDSISVSLVENDIEEISKEDKNEDSN